MAETGPTAFLALWNDIERGREAEYDAWHTREHVPERVAAPGFLSGGHYLDLGHPVRRRFTLYDVADLGVFRTPQYRDLLDTPSDWSAVMRPSFRDFLRVPCAQEHVERWLGGRPGGGLPPSAEKGTQRTRAGGQRPEKAA
jgi:hypothetical protein